MRQTSVETRFWTKVDKNGPTIRSELGPCWVWTASTMPSGYGQFGMAYNVLAAHRVAWTLVNGPIPDGQFVLHRCDNRPCVNPSHLFLGSKRDNTQDMVRKGRSKGPPRLPECPYGHPFNETNTYWKPYVRFGTAHVQRVCRICRRDSDYNRRLRAQ